MPTTPSAEWANEQFLGEIETRVVGRQYYQNSVAPGEQVSLEREPENPHDCRAIRVENGRCEPIGHLPRRVSRWLAPLVDSGQLRVDGYVPQTGPAGAAPDPTSIPLTLTVWLTEGGKPLLSAREVRSRQDALHEVVRRAYEEAQSYGSSELILELAEGLRPLARQELHPETHLLLAMLPAVAREFRVAQAFRAMAQMRSLLDRLLLGDPVQYGSLTVFPLAWPDRQDPPYVLLTPAIDGGKALVEEVDEQGRVPNPRVVNNGDLPILIPEGEILVGAKQNRVVNVTVLVAARSRFTLPVSCVERGRWEYRSRRFRGEYAAPPSLRSSKTRRVQSSRALDGEARGDQAEVWADVDACLASTGVRSETHALTDSYTAAEERLRELRGHLPLPEGAAGILVARRGKIVGMDLFDCAHTFGVLRDRLLDAYLLDALGDRRRSRKAKPDEARRFLGRVADAARPRVPALGLGDELEITGDGVVGGALLLADRICHLAAFAEAPS